MVEADLNGAPTTDVIAGLLRDAMAQGRQPQLTVISNSMSPLLRRGDRVRISPAQPAHLKDGDIVVVERPGALLTHRFWGTLDGAEPRLITRGDRMLSFDTPVLAHFLVGRVTARSRRRGFLALDSGAGAAISHFLARLSRLELHFFARLCRQPRLAKVPGTGEQIVVFSKLSRPRVSPLLQRAFHALAWGVAGWTRL